MSELNHKCMTVLNSGVVIDKIEMNALSGVQVNQVMNAAYGTGKKVIIVDSSGSFFRLQNLLALLDRGDPDWVLVAEKFNVVLTELELQVMSEANRIRARVLEQAKFNEPAYDMAPVPHGWILEENISLSSYLIRRTPMSTFSNEYAIGFKTLRNIWGVASLFWAGHTGAKSYIDVTVASFSKRAVFEKLYIKVGCQEIHRFELEQIALKLSWAFP